MEMGLDSWGGMSGKELVVRKGWRGRMKVGGGWDRVLVNKGFAKLWRRVRKRWMSTT